MKRQAQAVALLLLGGAVLRTALTGAYLRYVKDGVRPLLIAAGIALIVLAAVTVYGELRDRRTEPGHDHEPKIAWLLLLPVAGLLLVAPGPLGATAAESAGTALGAARSDYPPLPDGDPVGISVMEYASRAVFEDGRSLGERRVRLTGFVSRDEGGAAYLTRMVVSCCAADARPVKVGMEGTAADGAAEDAWIAVVGTYSARVTRDPVNGERIPYIAVESLERIEAPARPYE